LDQFNDFEYRVRRIRNRAIFVTVLGLGWFLLGLLLTTTVFADAKSTGFLSVALGIYLATILLSFIVALCSFWFVMNARRWVEVRAQRRVASKPEKIQCQTCGTPLKRRIELEGKKLRGVFTGADMDQFFGEILDSAYKCRNCGYLKCQSCVRSGGGCPDCNNLTFDSI